MYIIKKILKSFICVLILFSSCKSKFEKDVIGVWVIEELVYNNQNIKEHLFANAMTVRKNKTCDLPITNADDRHTPKEIGFWEISKKKNNIFFTITTTNELFNGVYKIEKIWKEADPKSGGEFLKMIISSDKLKIRCTRDAADIAI